MDDPVETLNMYLESQSFSDRPSTYLDCAVKAFEELKEERAMLRKSLAWALNNETDIIEVGGVLECIHCKRSIFQGAKKGIKHTKECPYALALALVIVAPVASP